MVWLLFLHICALLIWAASLLILPPLIHSQLQLADTPGEADALDRLWFTRLASPVALLTIITGSGIFVMQRDYGHWLLVKLTVVTALVICHVLSGLLILYRTRQDAGGVGLKCSGLFATILLLLLLIVILVLLKPDQDMLLWLF